MELSIRLTSDGSRGAIWSRRALTIPGLLVVWLLDLAALPLVLAVALVVDLARGRSFAGVRFHLAVAFALGIHVVGLLVVLAARIAGVLAGRARERELEDRGGVWWATTTWRAVSRIYAMRVVVEGEDALTGEGPVVIMSRHASLLDVLLPFVSARARRPVLPRYVAKRELLWDPVVDLLGHRIAAAFVRRGGLAHDADVAAVASLAEGLGPNEAVVIFPEGTCFSAEKRAKVLRSLAREDEAAYARAARLKNVLPPHLAGPLAVLERASNADVIFCAHVGLEGASHLRDLLAGSLVGGLVRVRYWRVAARDVPADGAAREEWLWRWWERIDAWIGAARR